MDTLEGFVRRMSLAREVRVAIGSNIDFRVELTACLTWSAEILLWPRPLQQTERVMMHVATDEATL